MYYCKTIDSPIGPLKLVASARGLCRVMFHGGKGQPHEAAEESAGNPALVAAEKQFAEYFAGSRARFDVKLDMRGTVFRQKAWRQLQKIPYGETISYGEQAKRLGNPAASRAVGGANGCNPLAVIVPCHRVIGANGTLTGFGGGLKTKEWLLKHEQKFAESAKNAA